MSALTEAREALATAQSAHADALTAEQTAKADAEILRQRITDGDPKVNPADITAADAKAEHARLAAIGAERGLDELHAAVMSAEVDAVCESVTSRLPVLGTKVWDALEALLDDLAPLVAAATAYDEFVDRSAQDLGRSARDLSGRVTFSRYGAPTVDHVRLESCRPASQLASAILPAMRALGAPDGLLDGLKLMAQGAPTIPTV
jgi:hypothetical protein